MKAGKWILGIVVCTQVVCASAEPSGPDRPIAGENEVIVYGSHGCGHCNEFVALLERDDIPHSFYDVNENPLKGREMVMKAREMNPNIEEIYFPLVDVNGTILMRPGYAEFLDHVRYE